MTTISPQRTGTRHSEFGQDGSKAEVFDNRRGREGSGDIVILCFHGSGIEAGSDWRALADKLAEKHITVLFDRGSGNTSPAIHTDIVSEYLIKHKLNGMFVIVAHSYGGAFAKHFLYTHRRRVAGMVLVETGKGGLRSSQEEIMLRRSWMGPVPLSVIRGNSLREQWQSLERKSANVSGEQESRELESRLKWLQLCDEEDEKLEKEQLKLSQNRHYIHLPHCGHNIIRDSPDSVVAEVQWVLENGCDQSSSWSLIGWLRELVKLVR